MKLSLESLLLRLVQRGRELARETPDVEDDRTTPTSLRFKPSTRRFLEAQAAALNTSLQGVAMMILDGVAETTTADAASVRLRTAHERFFMLMETHGLDLFATADLLSMHGFTPSALGQADRLVDLLTPPVFEYLARTFHVHQDWLRGVNDRVASAEVTWYTGLRSAARDLLAHRQNDQRPELIFVRRVGADFDRAFQDTKDSVDQREHVAIVLRLTKHTPSGRPLTTYQLWEPERWNYGKCRQRMKLLIAFCEHMRVSVVGHQLPVESLDALRCGSQLPVTLLNRLGAMSWYPDNYAGFHYLPENEVEEWENVKRWYASDIKAFEEMVVEAGLPKIPKQAWQPATAESTSQ